MRHRCEAAPITNKTNGTTLPPYETDQNFTNATALSVVNSYGAYVTSQCYTKTKDGEVEQ